MRVSEKARRLVAVVQIDHRRLRVGVSFRPKPGAQGLGADALNIRLADHAPVIVDVMADQVFQLRRKLEVGVRRTIDQLLVEDVAGGQRAQFNRLARLVALEEVAGHFKALDRGKLKLRGLDQLRVGQACGFAVEDEGVHADCS
ncbi:hypothetical protein D3C81_1686170 [compost metagenome]